MKKFKLNAEPLWWVLFSAGGVCFAVVVPAAILFIAILQPLGLLPQGALDANRADVLLFSLGGFVFIGAVICLPLFHAAHRLRHGLYDLKLGRDNINKYICYGSAALLSALALYWFISGLL
ncbi:fumarate reductase subunit D [Aliidiomarina minuta]|uniref:Fumarate reductase subunit D n=1 Tax=Aliidiomarina minuta TaxID=880057 RepID=A0A432W5Y5_9GAMM|nr:fumarate reductase subunit FrdD [Aliidiomarina minuta]RUO25484.1 fumarate reductase subunit D [Aliidiomarina minuta]